MAELSQRETEEYLGERHVAILSTVRPDGSPHLAPVWFLAEGGHIWIFTGARSVKARNIRANPLVALSIASDDRPYKYVILAGPASIVTDNLDEIVRRICVRYDGPERGAEFAREMLASGDTALLDVEVKSTMSWQDDG